MKAKRIIRIGTRNSALARWQADWVAKQLRGAGHAAELVAITTSGDESVRSPDAGDEIGIWARSRGTGTARSRRFSALRMRGTDVLSGGRLIEMIR